LSPSIFAGRIIWPQIIEPFLILARAAGAEIAVVVACILPKAVAKFLEVRKADLARIYQSPFLKNSLPRLRRKSVAGSKASSSAAFVHFA
jgi:hypothetical protein